MIIIVVIIMIIFCGALRGQYNIVILICVFAGISEGVFSPGGGLLSTNAYTETCRWFGSQNQPSDISMGPFFQLPGITMGRKCENMFKKHHKTTEIDLKYYKIFSNFQIFARFASKILCYKFGAQNAPKILHFSGALLSTLV